MPSLQSFEAYWCTSAPKINIKCNNGVEISLKQKRWSTCIFIYETSPKVALWKISCGNVHINILGSFGGKRIMAWSKTKNMDVNI